MIKIFKTSDRSSSISLLSKFASAIREFFATKSEMDVVASALTDLDVRIKNAIPTIAIGKVETVDSNKNAQVVNSGTSTNVVLDFSIPRGPQGDMREWDDEGYVTGSNTELDYCIAENISWQMRPDDNFQFTDLIEVPIPSIDAMNELPDCIHQTRDVQLRVGESIIGQSYEWSQLHWLLQCSKDSNIVYATRYAMPDADFPSVIDSSGAVYSPPSTVEIIVSYVKGGAHYVQITIENMYGRAYYVSTNIKQKTI